MTNQLKFSASYEVASVSYLTESQSETQSDSIRLYPDIYEMISVTYETEIFAFRACTRQAGHVQGVPVTYKAETSPKETAGGLSGDN